MKTLAELVHVEEALPNGGRVILLDTGATITPEDGAMLQALQSRSPASILEHLKRLEGAGSGTFMSKFYIGYGHASIGDCGTITLFIEEVSMLAVKAIQDWRLYSGQECSTRYMDFSTRPFIDPLDTEESRGFLEKLRNFYLKSAESVREHVVNEFPMLGNELGYQKAVSARVFDILRGVLPAGASTNVSWHANLRQTADMLCYLRHHPLLEVRGIAEAVARLVRRVYPSSFTDKLYEASEEYRRWWMESGYYIASHHVVEDFSLAYVGVDFELLSTFREALSTRPPKTELPRQIAVCGTMRFEFMLDFGSYRDLQRHRAVVQRMPLLTPDLGFEEWYISAMPKKVRRDLLNVLSLFQRMHSEWREKGVSEKVLQYYTPMGYRVPISLSGDIAALVYLAELRATALVHPTLQKRATQMADVLERELGQHGLALHVDRDNCGRFDVRRGTQDIVLK